MEMQRSRAIKAFSLAQTPLGEVRDLEACKG